MGTNMHGIKIVVESLCISTFIFCSGCATERPVLFYDEWHHQLPARIGVSKEEILQVSAAAWHKQSGWVPGLLEDIFPDRELVPVSVVFTRGSVYFVEPIGFKVLEKIRYADIKSAVLLDDGSLLAIKRTDDDKAKGGTELDVISFFNLPPNMPQSGGVGYHDSAAARKAYEQIISVMPFLTSHRLPPGTPRSAIGCVEGVVIPKWEGKTTIALDFATQKRANQVGAAGAPFIATADLMATLGAGAAALPVAAVGVGVVAVGAGVGAIVGGIEDAVTDKGKVKREVKEKVEKWQPAVINILNHEALRQCFLGSFNTIKSNDLRADEPQTKLFLSIQDLRASSYGDLVSYYPLMEDHISRYMELAVREISIRPDIKDLKHTDQTPVQINAKAILREGPCVEWHTPDCRASTYEIDSRTFPLEEWEKNNSDLLKHTLKQMCEDLGLEISAQHPGMYLIP